MKPKSPRDQTTYIPNPPSNRPKKMGGWECLHGISSKLISSGNGIFLIGAMMVVGVTWAVFGGMDSGDKLKAFDTLLGARVVSVGGWIVAVATALVCKYLHNCQKSSFERQLAIMRENKDAALAIQETLPLDGAVSPNNRSI